VETLEGFRVVELTTGIAGPIVGMFLSDFGAEVIKVEPPEGDPARSDPGFAVWNRGKKSVVADPADAGRRQWVAELIAGADVCLVSEAGLLAAYGLTQAALLRDCPRLIIVETPAYPGGAPWYGGRESHGLLSAVLGVAWRQSSFDGGPVESVARFLLQVHGTWATVCTVAALLERERSGFGQLVRVTGAQGAMEANVGAYSIDPQRPDPPTSIGPGGRHPTYTRFVAGDGKWLASGALGAKFERQLLEVLGLTWMLDEERMGGRVESLILPDNILWAHEQTARAFLSKDRDEWLDIMTGLGIPCGALADRQDWLDHDQVRGIGMRAEVDDPERGRVVMPGVPVNLTGSPGRVRGPAPALGQHDGEISARVPDGAGRGPAQVSGDAGAGDAGAPPAAGPAPLSNGPLVGFRILDMGTFVAGPYAGSLLSELGADVIKVEPLGGDPFRVSGFVFNRGMRSLAINLAVPDGADAFRRLAAASDVVVESMRPGVTTKLGIDYDALAQVHPGVITVSLSAYGEGGPLSGRPGVDMVLQAMSGMMSAQGGDSEPVANTIAIIDVTTGAMLALSTCLALLHRQRTGQGQRAWCSLAGTATYLQSGEIVRFAGRTPSPTGGRDYLGADPLDRYYPTSDGWVRIQAPGPAAGQPGEPAAVTAEALAAAGLEVDAAAFAADPAAALGAALAGLSSQEAAQQLTAAQVPAVPARRISSVVRDPQLLMSEFSHIREAADGSTFVTPGRYAVFSRTPRSGVLLSPGVGEHARQALAGAGLSPAEIEELISSGVVQAGDPMPQSLPTAYR
jgi:crotonobetainyl-CoA:carnitine CoA-transferase CaiB-like acyl-CoA transferase